MQALASRPLQCESGAIWAGQWKQAICRHTLAAWSGRKRTRVLLPVRSEASSSSGFRVRRPNAFSSKQIVIREPKFAEFWEVADLHCCSFFPDLTFPMDVVLRSDRVMSMLGGFYAPPGLRKESLVAVESGLSSGPVISGAATVDTLADFLPRRRPFSRRRAGIAYLSNVAVRPRRRRRGIARQLVREAERKARAWGCRSIALHCDMKNAGAAALYLTEGYRVVPIPKGASWPQPKAIPGSDFQLMLKLLSGSG